MLASSIVKGYFGEGLAEVCAALNALKTTSISINSCVTLTKFYQANSNFMYMTKCWLTYLLTYLFITF